MPPDLATRRKHALAAGFQLRSPLAHRERWRSLRALLGLCGWQLRRTADVADPGAGVALVLFDADEMKMAASSAIRTFRQIDSTLPVVILATSAASSDRAL